MRPPNETLQHFEDQLSPFAPAVAARRVNGQPATISWEAGPFTPGEGAVPAAPESSLDELEYEYAAEEGVAEKDFAEEFEEEESWGEVDSEFEQGDTPEIRTEADQEEALELGELDRLTADFEAAEQQLESLGLQNEDAFPSGEAWIPDIIRIGQNVGRLGQRIAKAAQVGPASTNADASVAVPPFNVLKRFLMPAALLTAADNAKAVRWNREQHPTHSGVDPADIRTDVNRYVNLTTIGVAIQNFNTANPAAAIQLGTPPWDAVLVEAIHQFQAKCFFEPGQIDGMAGESTLDSLGLVKRTGFNTVDRRNTKAHQRLSQIDVAGNTGNDFTADTWFDHMVNPTFLGWRFLTGGTPRGVHLSFMRKLRVAERALLAQWKYSGMTPVELGTKLGFNARSEEHKGARPTVDSASMHTYGLAVDIKYTGNPWVKGAPFLAALRRSALLMAGIRITQPTSQRFLHDLGADATLTTAQIYDLLTARNNDFRAYLELHNNPAGLTAALVRRRAGGTAGVFTSATETIDQAARRWQADIRSDLANMRANDSPFLAGPDPRNPLLGFLDLNRDLVIALRDTACLAWGAVDIGSGADGSGDMMHFDDRICGIGHVLAGIGRNFRPTSGHPCLACSVPATEEMEDLEAGEYDMEQQEESESLDSEESDAFVRTAEETEDSEWHEDAIEPDEEWAESEMEELAQPADERPYEEAEPPVDQESILEVLGRLLRPGAIVQRIQELLGEGLFSISLLSRFAAGQIWNEDHLALEVLFHRQPSLRPADLDRLSGTDHLKRLRSLAIKHQRDLTSLRERVVRPVFGTPSSFLVGPADGCPIQDLKQDVRRLGPLKGGEINGRVWYKRKESASPRTQATVDSIVLHHMAFNIGNNVKSYLKVGAHYAVTADGQIAQLYDDLDFMNASNGFNPRSVAIEFAGNFCTLAYHWWKSRELSIPDRCYLTPAQIRAGRCLVATLKSRLPSIRYIYAHRQSSESRENDPGPDVWFNVAQWAIDNLGLTDRLPRTHIGTGKPIPDAWRMARGAVTRTTSPAPAQPVTPKPVMGSGPLDRIARLAADSSIARYRWRDRGSAPRGYIKGMALVYAKVYCKLKAGDPAVIEMAKADTGNPQRDALAHYSREFSALGMSNATAGTDTLRHLFVLLMGLGMRESSGSYCRGRDRSAKNTSADTAEAGMFQTSYNLRTAHRVLPQLFSQYLANPSGFLDVFQEGAHCKPADPENFGTGSGKEFQRLSKSCPAFAAEFAAVGLRNRCRHWGPIIRKGAEIRPECDALLVQVQSLVDQAGLCPALT